MLNIEPCPLRTQFEFGEPLEMGLTDLRIPAEEIETEERVKRKYQKYWQKFFLVHNVYTFSLLFIYLLSSNASFN